MFNIGLEPRAGVTNDQMISNVLANYQENALMPLRLFQWSSLQSNCIHQVASPAQPWAWEKPPIYPKAWKGSKTILEPILANALDFCMSCSISDFPSRSSEERLVNRPTFTDVVSSLLIISCCNYEPSAAKKGLFPTSMNDFGSVGIWRLTQLLTTSRGAENLKLCFYRLLSTPFNFHIYLIFPFPNVRPSILPSPTLFPAQSKPKLLTSHRLWRRVSARMAISRR